MHYALSFPLNLVLKAGQKFFHKLHVSPYRPIITLALRNSSIGIATDYGFDGPGSILDSAYFLLFHGIHSSSGAHPASHQMGTGRGKAVGVVRLTTNLNLQPKSMLRSVLQWLAIANLI